jgi:hypothetical protein
MDPLSVTASIVAVLQLTCDVITHTERCEGRPERMQKVHGRGL